MCLGNAGKTCGGAPRIEGDTHHEHSDSLSTRRFALWYYHENAVINLPNGWIKDLVHQSKIDGKIWTGVCDNAIHRSQRLAVLPLKSSDWPRDPLGPSWPSFPSIGEWMGMLRRGISPFERPNYDVVGEGHTGYTCVSRGELSRNAKLATLIVRANIVGIRSSAEVPGKYLAYFRYRWNFLILTCNWCIPIGLVRFLLGQWIQNPYSLWLRRAVPLRKFLRAVPIRLVKRAYSVRVELSQGLSPGRSRGCTDPDGIDTDASSVATSELD